MPITRGVPTMTHRTILQRLWAGKALPIASLAPASSKSMTTIENYGWVERHIDGEDHSFSITKAGRDAFTAPLIWKNA